MRIQRLFGVRLASSFPFVTPLPSGEGPADLVFSLTSLAPEAVPLLQEPGLAPLYSSPWLDDDGESVAHLYRTAAGDVFSFSRGLEVLVQPARITAALLDPACGPLVELRLLGPVLSHWLECQGMPTLHASASAAAALDGRAVGFLSVQGGGKTGLAAAMMQAGHPLLTDDILPLEERGGTFLGRSGYPQMKMWPDEAAHFLGSYEHLPLVHPQVTKRRVAVPLFCDSALPLAALYVPERREGGPVEISPLSRGEAVIELVRHSFSPHLVQAVGLQPSRLDFFARLVRQVPVRRLAYPSGFERLPEVVAALRRDLS